jgi:hypothetical protein
MTSQEILDAHHKALDETIAGLKAENERLRVFISKWAYEGCLQTFGDRNRFRNEATTLLDSADAGTEESDDDDKTLRPCPFCDSEAKIESAIEVGPNAYVVVCQNPECMSSSKVMVAAMDNVDRQLIESWNRRARSIERSYSESLGDGK